MKKFSPELFQNEPVGVGKNAVESGLASKCKACDVARRALESIKRKFDENN